MGNLHTGVYALPYRNGKMGEIHFYNYSNLKTSSSHSLTPEKIQNLNLELILGNVFHNNSQFALVTEVYYPEYNYNNSYASSFGYYYGYGGYPTTTFVGYHFTHSYITTFDKDGNLLWDNLFPFNNVITNALYTKTSVYMDKEDLGYIYYNFGNSITSTLVTTTRLLSRLRRRKSSPNQVLTKWSTHAICKLRIGTTTTLSFADINISRMAHAPNPERNLFSR